VPSPAKKFVARAENESPRARTKWTKFHLEPAAGALLRDPLADKGRR